MMQKTQEPAFAKINLALDILGRREDGYHDLNMVMQTVSLHDTVTVEECGDGFLLMAEGFVPPENQKTMEQRAVEAFFAVLRRPVPPLAVRLEKVTPAYAGLGGGSADVAALLRGLRRMYAPDMAVETLWEIGLTVGSDVPFCVAGGTALAEGRGERLTALRPMPDCWLVLCKPDFGISTPPLFALADKQSAKNRPDISGMRLAVERSDLRGIAGRLCNVFEELLPQTEREQIDRIKARLRSLGAMNAAMSGSGPTVFGIFQEECDAKAAWERLKADYAQTYLAVPVKKLV